MENVDEEKLTPDVLEGRYVLFSDIQGNFLSLDRFFRATKNMKNDGYLCLGDIVNDGQNFSDNRCISAVKKHALYCVKGNHEENVSDLENKSSKIQPENSTYVSQLPEIIKLNGVLLFHSSTEQPGLRLKTTADFQREAQFIKRNYAGAKIGLFGHTHEFGVFVVDGDDVQVLKDNKVKLDPEAMTFINPGGIGLYFGLEQTFAYVDFSVGEVNFLRLEEAEKLAHIANIVNAFDERYMPTLNEVSWPWFSAYAANDIPSLLKSGEHNEGILRFAEKLKSFDAEQCGKTGVNRRRRYFLQYSKELAEVAEELRTEVKDFYQTISPITSREEYLQQQKDSRSSCQE
ncbi:metallophosphoesterase [Candidatus Woesearchaeota archaeon]|nr:metallophosphoesterase [Candidatus Woesearchaeota archaeon]